MSYILDALKRADSEREREREDVPGLHSKTDVWVAPDELPVAPSKSQAAVLALAVAGGVAVLGLLWLLLTREPVPAPKTEMSVGSAASPAAVPPAVPVTAAAVVVQPVAPTVAALPAPAPVPAPVLATPAKPLAAARVAELAPPAVVPAGLPPAAAPKPKAAVQPPTLMAVAPLAAPAASAAAVVAAGVAPSPEARIYTLSELPEELRAGLPALVVGGAMYSQTPANRMLIVNGQVYREGDTVSPGLVLEQIKLKSAVLKVKGLRYGISY